MSGSSGSLEAVAVQLSVLFVLIAVGVAAWSLATAALAVDPMPFRDAAEEARFRTLAAELRCVMCQNQSLADSNAPIAQDLRHEVLDDPQGQILTQGGRIYFIERAGEAVGCCALMAMDDGGFEVIKMTVAEAARGAGLGRLLLQACIDRARLSGAPRLYLETNSGLGPALASVAPSGLKARLLTGAGRAKATTSVPVFASHRCICAPLPAASRAWSGLNAIARTSGR